MKVVHVIKRIELIDSDIKDLRKLEKSLTKNKTFTTPIFITIEKQINIILDERIKLLGLKIENPPQNLVAMIEGLEKEEIPEPEPVEKPAVIAEEKTPLKPLKTEAKPQAPKPKREKPKKTEIAAIQEWEDDDDIPMLTQDLIDTKINTMKSERTRLEKKPMPARPHVKTADKKSDDAVKLLDIALEKGSLDSRDADREKEKKVKFFRENFPVE